MLIENNDSFLSELTRMFTASREAKGPSLFITMKKYRQKIGVEGNKESKSTKGKESKGKSNKKLVIKDRPEKSKILFADDDKCIIRAKIGNKKISTIISSKDLDKFQTAYSSLLRGNLYGLKDKKKEAKKRQPDQQSTSTKLKTN